MATLASKQALAAPLADFIASSIDFSFHKEARECNHVGPPSGFPGLLGSHNCPFMFDLAFLQSQV